MNKLLYILIIIPIIVFGQSSDQNWEKIKVYKVPTLTPITTPSITEANVEVTYFDGLGRPVQKISHQQSNSGKDIVTHIEYDSYGRQIREYLPYVNSNASLLYNSSAKTEQNDFYSNPNPQLNGNPNLEATIYPYREKEFESSPLDRVYKVSSEGNTWAMGQGNEIKFDYSLNISNEVKFYTANAVWNSTSELYDISIVSPQTYYNANELHKTITKDENWKSNQTNLKNNTTEEFTNKEGQLVLKRKYDDGTEYNTYYIYDQFSNLTYVLPPVIETDISQNTLDNLAYQYKYDAENRLVESKLPGKDWEFIIYDKLDRPVATGPTFTPYGGTTVGWMIAEYDVFGRIVQTGWKQMTVSASERKSHQNSINLGINPFSLALDDLILTKNYYDNYNFPNAPILPTQIEGQDITTNVKGMQTGTWTKVLDVNNTNASELSYTLYDKRYRPIRTYVSNYLGGFTQVDSKLDWGGKTLYIITTHKYNANATVLTVKDSFEYTSQDRLSLRKQKINTGSEQLIAKNTYDELGQLINKKVGGTNTSSTPIGLQTIDYTYNIRGWLKTINNPNNLGNDLFAFKINYDDAETATDLFNGNISETFWITKDNILRKYNYSYDNLNRLTNAVFVKPTSSINEINAYDEALTYDKNGNIITLVRNGGINAGLPNPIDNLTYTYDTYNKNLLIKVDDTTNSPQGFKDGTNTDDDYTYDTNGNLIKDKNKNITSILYNHLNLPTKIVVGTNTIEYFYNALGQKVTKKVTENSTITNTHYLSGGFQYKNNTLLFFPHEEGYVKYESNTYKYVFNYIDHLGNTRLSYTDIDNNSSIDIDEIIEENHYYPFGLKHSGYNTYSAQPNYLYKYNGKEWQNELGLNMYDMDMRDYDPAIARWTVHDPVVHYEYSPYNAFDNNPVFYSDPTGGDSDPVDEMENSGSGDNKGGGDSSGGGDTTFVMTGPEVVVTGKALYSSADYTYRSWLRDNQPNVFNRIRENEKNGHYNRLTTVQNNYWGSFSGSFNAGYRSFNPNGAGADMMDISSTMIGNALLGPAADAIIGAYAFEAVIASKVGSKGLTELELVEKAAVFAEKAIGGKGPVAGTNKHTYAIKLLERYQKIYGSRGLEFNHYFNNGVGNRGFLDVISRQSNTIYDFKFGSAVMNNAQFAKYSNNFPTFSITIIKP